MAALVPCQPRPSNLSVSKLTWAVGGPPHTYIKEKAHTQHPQTHRETDRQCKMPLLQQQQQRFT